MKNITPRIAIIILAMFSMLPGRKSNAQVLVDDSVAMGAGYASEIYYSMANGEVQSNPRNTWDIAFRATIMSASILTNDGVGVVLYTYPNADTSGWSTLDTNGMASWTPMYNDPDEWENGAFCRNAAGHPDYGWGVYNDITHNLKGDSIYVIRTKNNKIYKLWIISKQSALNTYTFRFAKLDGTGLQEVTLDCMAYTGKNFVGYDLELNQVADFEAPNDSWDILFTRYMSVQPNGEPYGVVGVISNIGTSVAEFWDVGPAYNDWADGDFDAGRSPIGWNWKTFDMGTFSYIVDDSVVFFVATSSGDVYKLVFTAFAGTSSGKIVFKTVRISAAGLDDSDPTAAVSCFPNPSEGLFRVSLKDLAPGDPTLVIRDMTGRTVYREQLAAGTAQLSLDASGWPSGMYLMTLNDGTKLYTQKIILR